MNKFSPEKPKFSATAVQARANYDRLSRWYDWLAGSEAKYRAAGLAALAAQPGEQILEIGFGTGQSLAALATAVGETGCVYGLDVSPGMLQVAAERLERVGLRQRVDLRVGDAVALPYETAVFDGAFLSFTLELFAEADIPHVLAEIHRVLRTNGRLCVVSLAKQGAGTAVRLYEWCHARWPAVIDCRPIYVPETIRAAGFRLLSTRHMSMWGLPVAVVLAGKRVA